MRGRLALLVGRAIANLCIDLNQGRPVCFLCRRNRCRNRIRVVAVFNLRNVPAISLKAFHHVLCKRNVSAALNGDMVAVIKQDQLRKPHRSRKGRRFRCNTFL